MKQILITIAVVVLVGCGESQQSAPAPEVKPVEPVAVDTKQEPATVKAPDISIHSAVEERNIEAIKKHLAIGTDVNAKGENRGATPLHWAAFTGYKEISELLIENGADVNAIDDDGISPLLIAAARGNKEIAELLITQGADVNAKDAEANTPIDLAIRYNHPETVELLRKREAKTTEELNAKQNMNAKADAIQHNPLDVAIAGGNAYIVELLINNGEDVNKRYGDEGDKSPLLSAVFFRQKEIAELLINKGADMNAKNRFGQTPLDLAESKEQKEIADLLRKHGAKTSEELKAKGK